MNYQSREVSDSKQRQRQSKYQDTPKKLNFAQERLYSKVFNSKEGQEIINQFKWDTLDKGIDFSFIGKVCYKFKGIEVTPEPILDRNSMTFRELGITTGDIIDKLIKSKLLPFNFYFIKER